MHHRRKASILRFILLFLYLNDSSSRDTLFANCLFWDAFLRVAFLRYASLRVGSLRDASLRVAFLRVTSAWCLFVCCLFACWLFAWCLFACCFLAWCLFLRDTYMIVAFLVFLPFTVVFFFTNFDTVYFRFHSTLFIFRLLNFVIDIPSYNSAGFALRTAVSDCESEAVTTRCQQSSSYWSSTVQLQWAEALLFMHLPSQVALNRFL